MSEPNRCPSCLGRSHFFNTRLRCWHCPDCWNLFGGVEVIEVIAEVECIGRGSGDGCGYIGGRSGYACPTCGGMLLRKDSHSAPPPKLLDQLLDPAAREAKEGGTGPYDTEWIHE